MSDDILDAYGRIPTGAILIAKPPDPRETELVRLRAFVAELHRVIAEATNDMVPPQDSRASLEMLVRDRDRLRAALDEISRLCSLPHKYDLEDVETIAREARRPQ